MPLTRPKKLLAGNLSGAVPSANLSLGAADFPAGHILQVKRFSSTKTGATSQQTTYNWIDAGMEGNTTALGTNSTWVVTGQMWYASRYCPVSIDIWHKVGSSGTWDTWGGHGTSGGNETGSYGLGCTWNSSASDIWQGNAQHASGSVTHAVGDTCYFKLVFRRGGPGTDSESGNVVAGHNDTDMYLTVMEIKT